MEIKFFQFFACILKDTDPDPVGLKIIDQDSEVTVLDTLFCCTVFKNRLEYMSFRSRSLWNY